MDAPFSAYVGDDRFIFVCYAHDDSSIVYPEIEWLSSEGLNLWYDEGISAGSNWRAVIGDSLLRAGVVLFYVSRKSLASEHCNREIGLALDEGITVVPVYLEDVELTSDLKVGLNRVQWLTRENSAAYRERLLSALGGTLRETRKPPVKQRHLSIRTAISAVVVGLLVIIGAGWWYASETRTVYSASRGEAQFGSPSIAVLPFVNLSGDPDQTFFSDGISEEILSRLARNPGMRVISRSSAFSFRDAHTELPLIAEQLGVDHVLEGSVRRSGQTVRVSVQLIDAASDTFLWSGTYDRELNDILAVQSEIATQVAREMNVALGDGVPVEQSVNPQAYLLYSQGRHLLGLGANEHAVRAKDLLEEAVALDPTFVSAWTELARAHGQLRSSDPDAGRQATESVERALSLNPDDAVANAWRGWELVVREGEFEEGFRFYNRSIAQDPTNVDVLRGLVNIMELIGRPETALQISGYVVDRDPLCIICLNNMASAYRGVGQIEASDQRYERSLALSPESAAAIRGLATNRILEGDGQGALKWIARLSEDRLMTTALKAMALHEAALFADRDSMLTELKDRQPEGYAAAIALGWIGNSDRAFELLESFNRNERLSVWTLRNPLWRNLRSDPRWHDLMVRSGFSPERFERLELDIRLPECARAC